MFDEILEPKDKIKALRKHIKATQQDIAGNSITRNFISLLENGRATLVWSTANIIATNINKIASRKSIGLEELTGMKEITAEYLMKEPEDKVNNIFDESVKELKVLKMCKSPEFKNKLNEIEKFIEKENMGENRKSEIYSMASDYFFEMFDLTETKLYVLKQWDIALSSKDYDSFLLVISRLMEIYFYSNKFEDTVTLSKFVNYIKSNHKINNKDSFKKIYFNTALALKNLDKYSECLKLLNSIKSKFTLTERQELDIEILKANCYRDTGLHEKASEIHEAVFSKAINLEDNLAVSMACSNIAMLEFLKGNGKIAYEYIEKSLDIEISNLEIKAELNYYAFAISCELSDIELTKTNFNNAMEHAEIIKSEIMQILILFMMSDYCIKNSMDEDIIKLVEMIKNKVEGKIITNDKILRIIFKVSDYFTNVDKKIEIINIGSYLVKILEENEEKSVFYRKHLK